MDSDDHSTDQDVPPAELDRPGPGTALELRTGPTSHSRPGVAGTLVDLPLRLVRVEWEGTLALESALGRIGATDYGLYQIYASHPVFGPDTLLYVGRAMAWPVGQRLLEHQSWLLNESDVTIRVGRIPPEYYRQDEEWLDWAELITDAVALTRFVATPVYQTRGVQAYAGQPLHLFHQGARGRLLPECSSRFLLPRPDDEADGG